MESVEDVDTRVLTNQKDTVATVVLEEAKDGENIIGL